MKEIQLTKGYVAIVDDEDFEWISKYRWKTLKGKTNGPYAMRTAWCQKKKGYRAAYLHREVLSRTGVDLSNKQVDHINGNGLDNRRCNLRPCTTFQNAGNLKRHSQNKSGFRGVTRGHGRWCARLGGWPGTIIVGYFDDPIEAAKAWDRAAVKRWGEFASLNFPEAR